MMMMMGSVRISEKSVSFYQTAQRHMSEPDHPHTGRLTSLLELQASHNYVE
jgi:hypothetical protein